VEDICSVAMNTDQISYTYTFLPGSACLQEKRHIPVLAERCIYFWDEEKGGERGKEEWREECCGCRGYPMVLSLTETFWDVSRG
jgi:hypothetical protein